MEFLNNHSKITTTELKILIDFTISSLKSDYEVGIMAVKSIDDTKRRIWSEFIETNLIYKYKDHFEEVHRIYRYSLSNYNATKVDVVKSVLKKEVHQEFLQRSKIEKLSNYTYYEDFDNITYENFVTHLLKYDVYQKSYNRLSENLELYILFYEVNDYKKFTFEKFEDHVVNSTLFRNIFSKYYPSKQIPIAVKRIDDYFNIIYDIIKDSDQLDITNTHVSTQRNTNVKIDKINIESDICKLDNIEKSFLFHVMCKALSENKVVKQVDGGNDDQLFNLPATELCKLSMIIDVQNKNTFDNKKYRDSDHYKILRIGIEFIEKKNRIYFITTLLEKIKDLKLLKTTKYIKEILDKEHNNLIKTKN